MNKPDFDFLSNLSNKEEYYLAIKTESLMKNLCEFLKEFENLTDHKVNPILKNRLQSINKELQSYYGYEPCDIGFNVNGSKKVNKIESIINNYPERYYIPLSGSLFKQD